MTFTFLSFKETFSLFFKYIKLNKKSKQCIIFAIFFILIDVMAASLVPFFSKQIVNSLNFSLLNSVFFSVMLFGFFWTLEKISLHIQEIVFFPIINIGIRDITHDVVQHIHEISLSSYQKLSMPEILNSIKRISLSARVFLKIFFLMLIPTTIKLSIAIFVVLKLGNFGWILCLGLFLSILILYKGTQWYVQVRNESWNMSDQVQMRINDSMVNTKTLRLYLNYEMNAVAKLLDNEAKLWFTTNTRLNLIHLFMGIILGFTITWVLYSATKSIQAQKLTVGDFVLLKGQIIAAFLPFKNLTLEFRQLAESTIDLKKIIELFKIPKNLKIENNTIIENNYFNNNFINTKLINFTDIFALNNTASVAITLNDIHYKYSSQQIILQNLNLNIKIGEKVCITGMNGSGKSCLMHILAGLVNPQQGSLKFFNYSLSNINKSDIGKIIHFVSQDFRLLNLSLRENLIYGIHEKISDNTLNEMIHKVGLKEFYSGLVNGFDTPLGEMGIRLSGGEKQRVAIARALLLKPHVLLLDETLNALPLEEEIRLLLEVFKVIDTIVVVSHRTHTFSLFDHCYELKKGKLFSLNKKSKIKKEVFLELEQ